MNRTLLLALLVSILITAPGCLSVSRIRIAVPVETDTEFAEIGMWVNAPGMMISHPRNLLGEALASTVCYPVDVLLSTVFAFRAVGDPSTEIILGPVGAIVGIALPIVTVTPYLYPPLPEPPTRLSPEEYERLLAEVERDSEWARVRVFDLVGWLESPDEIIRLEVIDPDEPELTSVHGRWTWRRDREQP